ncbi:small ribosomal subunit biogenesis GTPase RsgA [Gallaecimonas kandeliae]|uniref:small ribosomal subunit biogenesis GTPase RsgA n=1 Tax=Gallaecimonas kandeliae TaxID=3029055 RepID=UPI002648206B|nr:small ribosomal subunit biogenesis GTPase RsgA [Gallaecimonas kandeliae]WKE65010.1 small ribosomal subunit biogenesis GTPase RsgA [Gallaecimonas kandeliae]
MAKRSKLTQGQQRRVKANQAKRLKQKDDAQWDDAHLGQAEEGLVLSRFGQHADIESAEGDVYRLNIRRTIGSLVTGDKVVWRRGSEAMAGISGVVEAVHERHSVLTRPDFYDGIKPVAANIDQMCIVSSVLPVLSTHVIDRYLVAGEALGVESVIILNKTDLLDEAARESALQQLALYKEIGYQVLLVSVKKGEGMADLEALLKDQISIFVGQSGVGKSSLVNRLLPDAAAQVGDISENSGLGTHTTTVARLFHFPSGGDLIDSPGIREFALWHLEENVIARGFKEFRNYLGTCKFRDCKHKNDPGCALQAAVARGEVAASRLDSYHKIVDSLAESRPSFA